MSNRLNHIHPFLASLYLDVRPLAPLSRRPLLAGRWLMALALLTLVVACWPKSADAAGGKGKFRITVIDEKTKQPIACRMHLKWNNGKPRRVGRLPFWQDHFVFDGTIDLELPPGTYLFDLERGPEYHLRTGRFVLNKTGDDGQQVDLPRYVNMAEEGWWAGDLCVARQFREMDLLMRAEDLYVAQLITSSNKPIEAAKQETPADALAIFGKDRYCQTRATRDERSGGSLLLFNSDHPPAFADEQVASSLEWLMEARHGGDVWVDAERPFSWELPVWLAQGLIDTIGLANSQQCRSESIANEAGGKPRDLKAMPGAFGVGEWSQTIYYHVLNCGMRIPPSAGSGSGIAPNPVGYNRVYVHCGQEFSYENWCAGLRAGRVMVTNGPMLRPIVNGSYFPGHVFKAPAGETVTIDIALNLATRDKINYLEIVRNGKVEQSVRLAEWAKTGKLPLLKFDESGWFLVRAVTEQEKTYRFASTGPYYVEVGDQPRRISRNATKFFLDWTDELLARPAPKGQKLPPTIRQQYQSARDFWSERAGQANAD